LRFDDWETTLGTGVVSTDGSGNVAVGGSSPSYKLDVTGDINATGGLRIGGTAIGEWTTFTPVWDNVTIGNAINNGWYTKIKDTTFYRVEFVFGSTSSFAGDVMFYFPFADAETYTAAANAQVWCEDSSGSVDRYGSLYRWATNRAKVAVYLVSGSYVGADFVDATTPFTWASGDRLIITGSVRES